MKHLVFLLCCGFCTLSYSQSDYLSLAKQQPDSVRTELRALFTELSSKHPGFYRYNDKQTFDALIDSTFNTINAPITELEIFRKVKPLIARIGCLHTGVRLSEKTEKQLNSTPNCLPFTLFMDQGKAVVWKSFVSGSPVKVGDEIISINGRDIQHIYEALLKNVPMDGYNTTGKYKLLQYTFPEWYRNIIEATNQYTIELADGEIYTVAAIRKEETFSYADIVREPMSLKILDSIALITIPSFANSYLKSHRQSFRKEIKSYQKVIAESETTTLLFDVRGNTGGSDSNPAWLTALFFDQPYRYWDRIEVLQPIAEDITGVNRIFYGKPRYEEGHWSWSDKGLLSKEFKYTNIQKPSRQSFSGKVYILTDGLCLSSCADFVAIMQANGKATVIGEETGGGYYGNTSGLIPSEHLQCGLIVEVPLLKYINAVPAGNETGRGTIPDIRLEPTLNELNEEGDYMKRVINLLKESS